MTQVLDSTVIQVSLWLMPTTRQPFFWLSTSGSPSFDSGYIFLRRRSTWLAALLFVIFYVPSNLAGQCNNTTVLSLNNGSTGSWQNTTGHAVSVRITAIGGGGGAGLLTQPGGTGATQVGSFLVQNNETIYAVAGAAGQNATLVASGGGGGASGAINQTTSTVLVIAGGGGGGSGLLGQGEGGTRSSSPCSGTGNGGTGAEGGAGGGYASNGGNGLVATGGKKLSTSPYAQGGNGFAQALNLNVGGDGGRGIVGGGGGGLTGGGGGGGVTGGNGGGLLGVNAGAGGTSCNSSSNQGPGDTNGTTGGGSNAGSVTIICLGAAPVELTDFKVVSNQSGYVTLGWETATEVNNAGFTVQHGTDISHWEDLAFVEGKGQSFQRVEYFYTDRRVSSGQHYYRLVQTDYDGHSEHSPILTVRLGLLSGLVFPNPSADRVVYLRLSDLEADDYAIDLFNVLGAQAFHQTLNADDNATQLQSLHLESLPAGTYRLVVTNRHQSLVESVVLR